MFLQTLVATTLCVIGIALAEESPVFLWGAKAPSNPALQTLDRGEFQALISALLKDHMVVAFQENALRASDFHCGNAANSDSCYAHLQGIKTKTYYASVEDPIEAVKTVAKVKELNSVSNSNDLASPITCQAGKAVFVTFEGDSDQSRETLLEDHDIAIARISKSIDCPTVYLYLAAPSTSPKRSKRAIDDTAAPYVFRKDAELLIYYTQMMFSKAGSADKEIIVSSMDVTSASDKNMSVSLVTNDAKTISFSISHKNDGYYTMSNVLYDGVVYRAAEVNAPLTFSYHCGNLTLKCFSSGCDTKLKLNSFQFQAPFGTTTNVKFPFGEPWDCVPFFSPGILMGLFVIILLLSITFVGICWMMDINTMDRFDDPKGKTITINASD